MEQIQEVFSPLNARKLARVCTDAFSRGDFGLIGYWVVCYEGDCGTLPLVDETVCSLYLSDIGYCDYTSFILLLLYRSFSFNGVFTHEDLEF